MKLRIILLALLVLCPAAHAGAILELQTTEYSQDGPVIGTIEVYTQGEVSRIEITSVTSNESGGMIYQSNRKEMTAIDHSAREYYVIDQPTMDRMAAQVRAAMAQMDAALEGMPPEERALAEQMMHRSLTDDKVPERRSDLKATGARDTVAGYACRFYDVRQEGHRIREICMTPWSDIAEGRQAANAMMELAVFFEDMRKAVAGAGGLEAMDRQQEMFAYMKKLNGYPVLSRDFDVDGNLENESRLTSARSEDIPSSMFEAPASYQQRALQ
jgi:hypothetical protein